MSFSLEVFAAEIPADLPTAWSRALETRGLAATTHPGFDPATWRGGWLPWRLVVTGGLASSGRYPSHPIAAGFELDVGPNEAGTELADLAPEIVRRVVAGAPQVFHLSTSAARTPADLRLQCLAAATLAGLTGGVVYDPQQDAFYTGEAAVGNAEREADAYETASDPDAWVFQRFENW